MKEAVTKVIDKLTQEEFHGAFQKLLERYNKCIATGGDYFEGGLEFHVSTINKSAHTKKKSGNLFNDPRTYLKPNKYLKKETLPRPFITKQGLTYQKMNQLNHKQIAHLELK